MLLKRVNILCAQDKNRKENVPSGGSVFKRVIMLLKQDKKRKENVPSGVPYKAYVCLQNLKYI